MKNIKKQCNEINLQGTIYEEEEIHILSQNIVEEAEAFLQQHQLKSNQKQKKLTE